MDPCAVVLSASDVILPEKIIQGILGKDLPEAVDLLEGVEAYPWKIKTKYYDAAVQLCAMKQKTIGNQDFAESVNAVVICFDSQLDDGLSEAERWLPFTNEFNSDINILVCEQCQEVPFPNSKEGMKGIDRVTAVNWGIKHGFELVELNPVNEETDFEDDFPETVGMERIKQALEAHLWPNMIRKAKNKFSVPSETELMGERTSKEQQSPESMQESQMADEDEEPFEALFQNLSLMKSKADNLPSRERKDFAEKMAIAFWRAIGGCESEIKDLESEMEEFTGEEASVVEKED